MKRLNFSETIAASDLKDGGCRHPIETFHICEDFVARFLTCVKYWYQFSCVRNWCQFFSCMMNWYQFVTYKRNETNSLRMKEVLVSILHIPQKQVTGVTPFYTSEIIDEFHMCEELVPIIPMCEEFVPNLHIATGVTNTYRFSEIINMRNLSTHFTPHLSKLSIRKFQILQITSGRRQSKTLSTIDERGSKIDRNSAFDCHLSPVWRQMAIENTVSIDFFYLRSSIVLAFKIAAYPVCKCDVYLQYEI